MAENLSRHLKGLFTAEDLTESGVIIRQDRCLTLQHYHYDCYRSRNTQGVPYGKTVSNLLFFTVRLPHPKDGQFFFQQLKNNIPHTFSFLFNATFDEHGSLKSYDNALTVRGFLVDLEEEFHSSEDEQMQLHVQILQNAITYIGREQHKTLVISQ